MNNLFKIIFPLEDWLYIYQLEEYNWKSFLHWVRPRLFKRNLQSVGKLEWTQKAKLIYALALFLFLLFIVVLFLISLNDFFLFIFLTGNFFILPFWIVVAHALVKPIENRLKNKIINQAKDKLRSNPELKIIAVAGSVGKSTTKSFIVKFLESKYKVFTPKGNINTLLGIGIEINRSFSSDIKFLVVELGEYLPGDLVTLAKFLNPETVVLTKVGSQHLEKFGDQDEINKEFLSLANYQSVQKVFISETNLLADKLQGEKVIKVKTASVDLKNSKLPKSSSTNENLSLAAALARDKGVKVDDIEELTTQLESFDQRLKVTENNGITIIDDSYNISPESASNALEFLKTYQGRKIVVTGGIVDQGQNALAANREFAKQLAHAADIVIVAANNFHSIIKATIEQENPKVEIITSPHPSKTPEFLQRVVNKGDVVLVENELPEIYWH